MVNREAYGEGLRLFYGNLIQTNTIMKRTLFLVLSTILSITGFAYDVEQDGIYYNFIEGKNEVAVAGSSISELVIPNRIFSGGKEYVVTTVNRGAFYDRKDLVTVQIGDSVRDIMNEAFSQCEGLEKVTFGKMVTTIGDQSFIWCTKLDSICIPDSVGTIGKSAFAGCTNLRYLEVGKKVSWFQASAFANCQKLEHIVFKKPLSLHNEYTSYALYFSENAFQNSTGMKRVDIEDLTAWCHTSGNGWPSSPLTYGPDLYLNGELITKLVIPEDASSIGNYAFQNCPSIISVELPAKIWVSDQAFRYSGMQTLRLKGGADTYMSAMAFSGCSKLMKVIAENETPANISDDTFNSDTYYKGTLYVPVGAKETYKAAPGWKKFSDIKEGIPDPNVETYVLTINAGYGGTVVYDSYSINSGKQTIYVDEGTEAKISFLPYSGYILDDVQLNGVSIVSDIENNQYTIPNITSNLLLDATFKLNPFYLTIRQTNAATITKEVKARERIEVGITPSDGWKITNVMFNNYDVTYNVLGSNSYTTPQITGNSELVITQEPLQCKVACTTSAGGVVYVSDKTFGEGYSEMTLQNGEYLYVDYQSLDGFRLKKLFVDGMDVTDMLSGTSYQYGQLTKDIAIQALFEKEDKKQYNLEIQDADYGVCFMRVPEGQTVKYTINNVEGWKLNTVSFNGLDVTSDVEGNTYTTPEISGNSLLSISFEKDESSAIRSNEISRMKVYTNGNNVVVENVNIGQTIRVFDMDGIAITQVVAHQSKVYIPLSSGKVYLISIGTKTVKLAM